MSLIIMSNNRVRDLLHWHDLTEKEQAEFDYLDTDDKRDAASFVRYRGWVHDLGEFMSCPSDEPMKAWHGYQGDSFFSGVLVRFIDGGEGVIMARYFS